MGTPSLLRASVVDRQERRTVVECVLATGHKDRATAVVAAARVPSDWQHGGSPAVTG
jgi:hypothetical protein